MRPRVSANQSRVCRSDENAQRCRSQVAGVGAVQIREMAVLITAPKGGLLGEGAKCFHTSWRCQAAFLLPELRLLLL